MQDMYMDLYEKLSRLQWLMRRQHLKNHMEHGPMADPTRGQGRVLAILRMQEEVSTKDLAYLLGIRQQSLNELLNKLEKSGYIVRTPSDADKRVMMVKLTEKGRNARSETVDFGGIFDCLNKEELNSFSDYLDRIIDSLENQLGIEPDDDTYAWMHGARARMGKEQFDRMMNMRWGGFPFKEEFERFFGGRYSGRDHRPGPPPPHHGRCHRGSYEPNDSYEDDREDE